jgi:hemerythrin
MSGSPGPGFPPGWHPVPRSRGLRLRPRCGMVKSGPRGYMAIDWSPELTLNDELLDAQHVDLFRKLESAAAALEGPREALDAALAAFSDALMSHLSVEEHLMDEGLYPERARHRSAHELFVAEFERMRAELRESGPTPLVADWVRRRIPEWLRFHIQVNDRPLATWLLRRRHQGAGEPRRKDDGRRLS